METNKEYQKPQIEVIALLTEESIVAGSATKMGSRDPGGIDIRISNSGFFSKDNIMDKREE